jgi:hypothetical protein
MSSLATVGFMVSVIAASTGNRLVAEAPKNICCKNPLRFICDLALLHSGY